MLDAALTASMRFDICAQTKESDIPAMAQIRALELEAEE